MSCHVDGSRNATARSTEANETRTFREHATDQIDPTAHLSRHTEAGPPQRTAVSPHPRADGIAVVEVAGDPQDGGLFPVFFGVPCGVVVMTAGSLLLALRPSATAYVSHGGTPTPARVETITR
jgi:hypothetical protein